MSCQNWWNEDLPSFLQAPATQKTGGMKIFLPFCQAPAPKKLVAGTSNHQFW
jgi:hypothetical protein